MKPMIVATAATASVIALAGAASAEDAQNHVGVSEVVVTAQKRAENVQQVPIAISALSSQFLESRGISSIESLGSLAPDLTIERAPSDKTITQIAIRGSVTINPAVTWEPAVGLYLNGVYIAKAQGSIFDVADLERVEVLRGPQGTLYGRNALAGAINLVPRAPTGKFGGSLEGTLGNFGYHKEKLILDLPAWGPFSLKVSGQIQQRDGFVSLQPNPYPQAFLANAVGAGRTDDLDGKSGMVQLRFHPQDSLFTADYVLDYTEYNQRPQFAQLYRLNTNGDVRDLFTNAASPFYAGAFFPLALYASTQRLSVASIDAAGYERSHTLGNALNLSADLGALTVKSITAFRWLHWSDNPDLDGSPLPVAETVRDTHFNSFSQELQATGKALNGRLNYVGGLFYYRETAETQNPQTYFAGGSVFKSNYGSHTRAFAAYAQADYALTEQLKVTLGGRYTHEEKDISRFYEIVFAPSSGITTPTVLADIHYGGVPDAKYDSFTPSATISYAATRDINLYARYARGFKSGGFNGETNVFVAPTAQCPSGAPELCNPYKPETVDSYEIGAKTKWLDGRLVLNLAAFWDEHSNIQLSVFTASGAAASEVLNAAKARIRGVEVEAVLRPTEDITLGGSLAGLDPSYESYIDGGVDVSHNRAFPHAPHYTAAFNSDFRLAHGNWGELHLMGDVSYVSSYFTYPFPLVTALPSDQNAHNSQAPARTIVNLRGAVTRIPVGDVKLDVSVWVKNLTDYAKPSNFIDFGPGFGGLDLAYFPDPRTFGVTLGVKF